MTFSFTWTQTINTEVLIKKYALTIATANSRFFQVKKHELKNQNIVLKNYATYHDKTFCRGLKKPKQKKILNLTMGNPIGMLIAPSLGP